MRELRAEHFLHVPVLLYQTHFVRFLVSCAFESPSGEAPTLMQILVRLRNDHSSGGRCMLIAMTAFLRNLKRLECGNDDL